MSEGRGLLVSGVQEIGKTEEGMPERSGTFLEHKKSKSSGAGRTSLVLEKEIMLFTGKTISASRGKEKKQRIGKITTRRGYLPGSRRRKREYHIKAGAEGHREGEKHKIYLCGRCFYGEYWVCLSGGGRF